MPLYNKIYQQQIGELPDAKDFRKHISEVTGQWNQNINDAIEKYVPEPVREITSGVARVISEGLFDPEEGLLRGSDMNPLGLAPVDLLKAIDAVTVKAPSALTGIDEDLIRKGYLATGAVKGIKSQFKTTTTPYINPQQRLPSIAGPSVTVKPLSTQQSSAIVNSVFKPKRLKTTIASQKISKYEAIKLAHRFMLSRKANTAGGAALVGSLKDGTIEPGDTQGGHLGYFSSKFPDTTQKDLDLYGANIREFTKFNNFEDALSAGEVSNQALLETGKKRWPGIDAQIGDNYFKVYKGPNNQIRILPYNKWYQLKRNPFKVPDDVQANLKRFESRQLELLTPNSNEIVKYPKGTVNSFVRYVNREIGFQKEQQRLIEGMAKAIYKDAGIPYKRGKTWLSVDLSHAVPRSKGGPGYTFLEAWRENQTRGAVDILDDQTLIDLGIPRNWNEYFLRWHQEQGKGNPATDLGRLADISWDDYNAAQQGIDINLIKLRRKTINNLIQRQISDPTTFQQPGQRGATIGDDFEIMVRESKGLGPDDDIISSSPELTWSAKEFDLQWRAKNYNKEQSLKDWTEWEQNQPKTRKSKKPKIDKRQGDFTEDLYVEWTAEEYREFMEEMFPERFNP